MNNTELKYNNGTIDLLDYVEVILKRKKLIIRSTTVVFLVSIVISLSLPKIYVSKAMILPPSQDQGLLGAMMGQMGGVAALAGGLLGASSSADMYASVLKSDAVKDSIIERFKLMDVYKAKYRFDTYKIIDKRVDITAGKKDGIISIAVEDKDPKRAADMANAYVEELGKLTVRLNVTDAGHNRTFLEDRLSKAKVDLAKAEENIKNFQMKNKALDITEQAKGTIRGIADMTAQLAAEEVKLAALRHSLTDSNAEVKNQKAVIASLKGQIAKFEGNGAGGSIPTVGSVPPIGQEYMRLMREFKIQETLVELLTKQYEIAKLTEAKDVSSIQVLQKANIPDRKIKPRRSLIVLMTTSFAFACSILLSFILEYSEKMPAGEMQRWKTIMAHLKGKPMGG